MTTAEDEKNAAPVEGVLTDTTVPTIYCNSARVFSSFWDINFRLGHVQAGKPGEALETTHVTVFMSPGHAKAFNKLLQKHIEKFEEQYGEISLPAAAFESASDEKDE